MVRRGSTTLERLATAPDFSQRYTGSFDDDNNTIVGGWESSSDGTNWSPDFELTYTRAVGGAVTDRPSTVDHCPAALGLA